MSLPPKDLRSLRGDAAIDYPKMSSPGSAGRIPPPQARWATRVLVPAAVLLATAGILAYSARDALQTRLGVHVMAAIPKPVATAVPVSTGAEPDPLGPSTPALGQVIVQAPGWIEPAPLAVSVPALAEGVVKEVLVLEGDTVEAEQVVARLIDDDARLSLRGAEAAVAERTADVERAKAAVATADSQVRIETAAVDELRDDVTRRRDLVASGAVATGEFRRMEIRLLGLEARVVTAGKLAEEAVAALGQANAARQAALVARDEAALRLSRMDVRSPVAGVVLTRLVEPGTRISMNNNAGENPSPMSGTVLRVYDPAKLQVRVDVPLADAARIGVGTRAVVSTEALPDRTFDGVVSRVVHEANIQRNTVQFKVALQNVSPVLKPEMLTRVKLHGPSTAQNRGPGATPDNGSTANETTGLMLLVSTSAVHQTANGKGEVWIVDSSGGTPVARRREVAITPASEEGYLVVTSGLRLTDRVIIDAPPAPAIGEGMRLTLLDERAVRPENPESPTP